MPIIVKYNNDLKFRKNVAFRRIYRGTVSAALELGVTAACVIALILLLGTKAGRQMPVFMLYIAGMMGIYLGVKFIRTLLMVHRVQPGTAQMGMREFYFDEMGYTFGPMDMEGTIIETKWAEVDKAYITGDVIYISAMHRRHWAAVDKRLLVEGSWDELVKLIRKSLPKNKIGK